MHTNINETESLKLVLFHRTQTDGLTFDHRALSYTDEFIVDSVTQRCSEPVVAKQAQILHIPPPFLTVGVTCADTPSLACAIKSCCHVLFCF